MISILLKSIKYHNIAVNGYFIKLKMRQYQAGGLNATRHNFYKLDKLHL